MKKTLFLIYWCLSGIFAFAQNNLSLADALAEALENNFQVQIQADQNRLAALSNSWGEAGRWPTIAFRIATDVSRAPGTFRISNNSVSAGPVLNWTLFDGFRVVTTKEQLALIETLTEGNGAVVIENTLQSVILAYYQVLIAEKQATTLEEVLGYSNERLRFQELRNEVGTSGRFELLQFRQSAATDSANLIRQRAAVFSAYQTLNLVMGADPEMHYSLTDSLPSAFEPLSYPVLKDKMLSSNRTLHNQLVQLQLREKEMQLSRADLYPTLALTSSASYALGVSKLSDGRSLNQNNFQSAIGLGLNFNLSDGGRVRRAIQEAGINQEISQLTKGEIELTLLTNLRTLTQNYEAMRLVLSLNQQNVLTGKDNFFLAGERYNAGLITALDYRNIQVQYLNTQLEMLQTVWTLNNLETEIIRLIGGMILE